MAMDWGNLLGGLLGNAGDLMGLGSAVAGLSDSESAQKASSGLGLGAGLTGLITGGKDMFDAVTDDEHSAKTKNLGIAESALGLLGSGADVVGGALGLAGKGKAANVASYVSGGANLLGGGLGIWKAFQQYKEDSAAGKSGALKDAIMGGLGGVSKILGGITGIGSTASDKRGWKIANVVSSGLGSLLGMVGTGMNSKKAEEPQTP